MNSPADTGAVNSSPGPSGTRVPSWPTPPVSPARPSGVRCTVIRQLPLHARAVLHTRPRFSSAVPSSSMVQGLAWWLVMPRRLVSTVSPWGSRSRRSRVSADHWPVTWLSR